MPGPKPTQSIVAAATSRINTTTITTRIISARLLFSVLRPQQGATPHIHEAVRLFLPLEAQRSSRPIDRPTRDHYCSGSWYRADIRATLDRQRDQRTHPAESPPRTSVPCDPSPSELWWPLPGLCCCLGLCRADRARLGVGNGLGRGAKRVVAVKGDVFERLPPSIRI